MPYLVTAMLVIVAVIHLLPLPGVLGERRLETLYGISIADRNLSILMRHRAVMFGLLGAFILVAAFNAHLQVAAFILGFVSVASFLWLSWNTDGYNAQLRRVVIADVLALACIAVAVVAYAVSHAA